MPLRHIPLVGNASFTIQNTLWRKSRKQQILVIYVRKAKIMENTMGHECCKIGAVPMKSMFLWNVVPWCLEAFVLRKFGCTAGFVIQFTENMHFRTTMDLSTNGYLAATQRTNATHSTKVFPNTHVLRYLFQIGSTLRLCCAHCRFIQTHSMVMAMVVFIDRHACAKWLPIFNLPVQNMRMAGTHIADATSIFKSRGGICATRWLMSELFVRKRGYVETHPSPNGFAREPGWKISKTIEKQKTKKPKQKQWKTIGETKKQQQKTKLLDLCRWRGS